jgi:polyribonucleotide nucleotidyltransferase
MKREGRPNERETLTSRLIDRPIRPQFPKSFSREMQVIATVISFDASSDTDILALCGASASLFVSDIPMEQPIAGVRIVRYNGEFVINFSKEQENSSDINLIVAGSRDGICMVEGGGAEVDEASMMEAMDLAFVEIQKIIGAIEELHALAGKEKMPLAPAVEKDMTLQTKMLGMDAEEKLKEALRTPGKHERKDAVKAARNAIIASLVDGIEDEGEQESITNEAKSIWGSMMKDQIRQRVVSEKIRIDGRATDEIRDIWGEISVSPRAHGSAIFTRGETQAFVTATLGVSDEGQRLDFADGSRERRWMLQYNFPPFSTGEVRRMGGPKRREIGHGALARRALIPVIPATEDFSYVMRCVSDVLESNGSSSMATVCGASMALMDAGVPLRSPVAGIAMGLIKEGDQYVVLSDILGDEDHLGDMDFKVTGTTNGITAFQMDTKIGSIPPEVMSQAMNQAKAGRLHILNKMDEVISNVREDLSPHAPRITSIQIKVDKIRDIIGPGGRVIRSIQDQCKVKISTNDDGRIEIAATSAESAEMAKNMIREITQEPEVGKIYMGTVKRVENFGVFVEIFPGTEGLVHISELASRRVNKVTDVVNEGDDILVKVIPSDRSGKLRLSRKQALGEDLAL